MPNPVWEVEREGNRDRGRGTLLGEWSYIPGPAGWRGWGYVSERGCWKRGKGPDSGSTSLGALWNGKGVVRDLGSTRPAKWPGGLPQHLERPVSQSPVPVLLLAGSKA